MKNVNNCAKVGTLTLSFKDITYVHGVDDGLGYVVSIALESREEVEGLIDALRRFLHDE